MKSLRKLAGRGAVVGGTAALSRQVMVVGLAMAGSAAIALPALSGGYSNMVVFGTSFSDIGNLAAFVTPLPRNIDGRESNGPLTVDYLAEALGLSLTPSKHISATQTLVAPTGNNFAVGGAASSGTGIRTLNTQVNAYLGSVGGMADPNALYVVWSGGNDVASQLLNNNAGAIQRGYTAVTDNVAKLLNAGAKNIVVAGVDAKEFPPDFANRQVPVDGAGGTDDFNCGLLNALRGLAGEAPIACDGSTDKDTILTDEDGGKIISIDTAAFTREYVANAIQNGTITDPSASCTGASAPADAYPTCTGYMFVDGRHWTTDVHVAFADKILAQLPPGPITETETPGTEVPEPATLAMLGFGLAGLGLMRRRRQTV